MILIVYNDCTNDNNAPVVIYLYIYGERITDNELLFLMPSSLTVCCSANNERTAAAEAAGELHFLLCCMCVCVCVCVCTSICDMWSGVDGVWMLCVPWHSTSSTMHTVPTAGLTFNDSTQDMLSRQK